MSPNEEPVRYTTELEEGFRQRGNCRNKPFTEILTSLFKISKYDQAGGIWRYRVLEETRGIEEHFRGELETDHSGNFQESAEVALAKNPSNGEYGA